MKYIHNFKTNSDFENAYEGEEYLEPWVSLTKANDCEYITVLYEGDEYDLYYVGKYAGIGDAYVFLAGSKETINATSIDSSTGEVSAITVNNVNYEYAGSDFEDFGEYPYVWEESGNNMRVYTKDRNPSSGSSGFVKSDHGMVTVSEKRNPEVGDVIEYDISVEVVSVGQGQPLNKVDYNKPKLIMHFIKDESSEFDFNLPDDAVLYDADEIMDYTLSSLTLGSHSYVAYHFGYYNINTDDFINENYSDDRYMEGYSYFDQTSIWGSNIPNTTTVRALATGDQYALQIFGQRLLDKLSSYLKANKIINVWVFGGSGAA